MKNMPTYLPPPAAQRNVQAAQLELNQRVGVYWIRKIWTVVSDNPPAIRADLRYVATSQASGQSTF